MACFRRLDKIFKKTTSSLKLTIRNGSTSATEGHGHHSAADLLTMGLPSGAFGTLKKPTIVHSMHHSRIVGCTGGGDLEHDIVWFDLQHGHKHMCAMCKQVFLLEHVNAEEHVEEEAHETSGHGESGGAHH